MPKGQFDLIYICSAKDYPIHILRFVFWARKAEIRKAPVPIVNIYSIPNPKCVQERRRTKSSHLISADAVTLVNTLVTTCISHWTISKERETAHLKKGPKKLEFNHDEFKEPSRPMCALT